MTKFIRLLLILNLVMVLQPTLAAPNPENIEADLALMKTVKARVEFYMAQNFASVRQMVWCLDSANPTPQCLERINAVKENIRTKYPEMRRYLILQSLVNRTVARFFLTGKSADQLIPQMKAPTVLPMWAGGINNPLESIFHDVDIETTPVSASEMTDALTSEAVRIAIPPVSGSEEKYTNLPENLNGFLRLFCELRLENDPATKECARIRVEWDSSRMQLKLKNFLQDGILDFPRVKLEGGALRSEQIEHLFEEKMLAKFYETVRQYPYLALITSANPDLKEIKTAFQSMQTAAWKAQDKHRKLWAERESRPEGPTYSEYLELMDYGPVVAHTIEAFQDGFSSIEMFAAGETDYDSVAAKLLKKRSRGQLLEAGSHILQMLALNAVACWLPGSKYFKMGRRASKVALKATFSPRFFRDFIKPVCYSFTNVPFAIYFIDGSADYYEKTYNEIFSAMMGDVSDKDLDKNGVRDGLDSGERYLQEVSNLNMAQKLLLIDLLTAPIGTGALINAIKNTKLPISPELKSRLMRLVNNSQQ